MRAKAYTRKSGRLTPKQGRDP